MIHGESMELIEEMAGLEEGFLLAHIFNRITTANLSKHTFENTRAALAKTVAGITDPEDIQELRRDRSIGRAQMIKMIERHPDPEERKEAKRHLAWLEDEYVKMLADRMKELKVQESGDPLSEMTIDLRKMTYNGTVYACMKPARGETRRLYDIVTQTRPPFDPDTLRNEAHVTLVYSRKAGVDRSALDLNGMAVRHPRPSARVVSVEYWEGHDKDGYAVLKLDSPEAAALNREIQAAGAKHSFDDFQAHMTICGKVGPQTAEVSAWLQRINRFLDSQTVTLAFDRICFKDIKGD